MSGSNSRGAFILIEGLDKAGKSTQCALLAENLQSQKRPVLHLRFPDRTTPIGKMIDAYLKGGSEVEDHVIHLLFSANRWEAASKITSALESGTSVVVDRYYPSGVVFSAAKHNPSLSIDWARVPDVGLPAPDLALFLNLSPETAAARGGGYGEEKYETRQMQDRARELFNRVIKDEQAMNLKHWQVVDAGRSVDEVQTELLQLAEKVIDEAKSGESGEIGKVIALSSK